METLGKVYERLKVQVKASSSYLFERLATPISTLEYTDEEEESNMVYVA